MDATDKQRIIDRYNVRLQKHGYDIRSLASGTEERRRLKFDILRQVGIRSGDSVLDLGCGFGDFFGYLQEEGLSCDYHGIDINPELVAMARRHFPSARFDVVDIQSDPFPDYDYIVSCNAFNLRLQTGDNYAFVEDILEICYRHARKGVAIDFLTSYVDFESPEAFHYDPERVFAAAKDITKRVTLRHDYPVFEFCVYLYPDFQGWHSGAERVAVMERRDA